MTVRIEKPAVNVREKLAELDKPTGIAGEAMLRAETPQEQFQLINAGRKNLFYNGAMNIAQRSTSAVTVSDNSNEGYSTVDRWKIDFGSAMGGALSAQQVDAPSGNAEFGKALKLAASTVNGGAMGSGSSRFLSVAQYLEGYDLQGLGYGTSDAKATTYSFWVYTNKVGRYGFSTISRSSVDGYDVWGSYFDVHTANTWQKVVFTVEGNTSADIKWTNSYALLVDIYLSVADARAGIVDAKWTGYSSARVPGTYTDYVDFLDNTSNVFYVTGLQLEVGKVATPFEHRSYGEELALCQRYYYRHQRSVQSAYLGVAHCQSSTTAELVYFHPVPMRATPQMDSSATIRIKTADGTSGTNQNTTAITFDDPEQFAVSLGLTVTSGLVAGNAATVWLTGSADYIEGDAEL